MKSLKNITDDSSIFEAAKIPVTIIPGRENFFKVTTMEDWNRFSDMIYPSKIPAYIRVGEGYDIHRFEISRPLFWVE